VSAVKSGAREKQWGEKACESGAARTVRRQAKAGEGGCCQQWRRQGAWRVELSAMCRRRCWRRWHGKKELESRSDSPYGSGTGRGRVAQEQPARSGARKTPGLCGGGCVRGVRVRDALSFSTLARPRPVAGASNGFRFGQQESKIRTTF
jgi:hypothetical protein